jgi:hypothetical protein
MDWEISVGGLRKQAAFFIRAIMPMIFHKTSDGLYPMHDLIVLDSEHAHQSALQSYLRIASQARRRISNEAPI